MATVTVGCKLPHGIVLNVPAAYKGDSGPVELRGSNTVADRDGYGLTEGVDSDFFAAWLAEHTGTRGMGEVIAKSGVFAADRKAVAEAKAKEQAEVKTGFEGVNPAAPAPNVKPDAV